MPRAALQIRNTVGQIFGPVDSPAPDEELGAFAKAIGHPIACGFSGCSPEMALVRRTYAA